MDRVRQKWKLKDAEGRFLWDSYALLCASEGVDESGSAAPPLMIQGIPVLESCPGLTDVAEQGQHSPFVERAPLPSEIGRAEI